MIRQIDDQYFAERVRLIATLTVHSRLQMIRNLKNCGCGYSYS
jgi:hypothetical protein